MELKDLIIERAMQKTAALVNPAMIQKAITTTLLGKPKLDTKVLLELVKRNIAKSEAHINASKEKFAGRLLGALEAIPEERLPRMSSITNIVKSGKKQLSKPGAGLGTGYRILQQEQAKSIPSYILDDLRRLDAGDLIPKRQYKTNAVLRIADGALRSRNAKVSRLEKILKGVNDFDVSHPKNLAKRLTRLAEIDV